MGMRTPVLVVGAGVSGAVLALELARHGVPSLVAERTLIPPRPVGLDLVESGGMQMLRRLGLSSAVRALGAASTLRGSSPTARCALHCAAGHNALASNAPSVSG